MPARGGCVEGSRQAGAGAAGDKVPLFHPRPPQKAGQPLGRHGADLYGWPFLAQGQACADTQSTGQDFHPQHAEPFHFVQAENDALHLGNTGARCHGGVSAHGIHDGGRYGQCQDPPRQGQDIFPVQRRDKESIIHKNTDLLRFSQKKAEETDGKAAQYACKDPFYEQAEPEFVPVVQSHVGPKQLPVK